MFESRFRSVLPNLHLCVCNCMRVCVIIYCKRISILYKLIVKEIINYWVFLRYRCFYWSIIGAVLVENLSVFSHIFFHLYFSILYFIPLSRHVIRISFLIPFFFFKYFFFFFILFFLFLHWFGSIQRRFYDDHSKCKTCGCIPVTKYKSPLCIPCFYHFKIRIITRIITYIYPINFKCLAGIEEIVNRVYLAQIYLFVQDI